MKPDGEHYFLCEHENKRPFSIIKEVRASIFAESPPLIEEKSRPMKVPRLGGLYRTTQLQLKTGFISERVWMTLSATSSL